PSHPAGPERPGVGYSAGGGSPLTSPTRGRPKLRPGWPPHPPYPGSPHPLLPLFDQKIMIVSDEATAVAGQDWPKLVWVVDVQDETRSEEHTSELQSLTNLVCRLLLEKKKTPRAPSSSSAGAARPSGTAQSSSTRLVP